MPSYIQRRPFALQNACWGNAQAPLICIFQCRLRIPAGRFLPGDAFRVVEDLHDVRSGFCQRSILHLFRDRLIQKRNAPFLHTFRKLLLRQQCSLPAHFRGSVRIQNAGRMKSRRCDLPSTAPWNRDPSRSGRNEPRPPISSISDRSSSSSLHCGTSERTLCNCSYACCSSGVTFL